MPKRDNSPSKKKTKRKLLNNVYELIEQQGGNRQAFIKAMEMLQKRIAKAEENIGGRIDLEQLPKPIREYVEYGIVPNRVLKQYIDEAQRLRIKDIESIVYRDSIYYDDDDSPTVYDYSNTPVDISDVELNAIWAMLDEHPLNPIQPELVNYLNNAIDEYGKNAVAANISIRYSECLEITKNALSYKAGTDRSHFWISSFKHIITGRQMTLEESMDANEYNEMILGGEDYEE